eukprot:Sdes_comp16026_c0_seq1m5211
MPSYEVMFLISSQLKNQELKGILKYVARRVQYTGGIVRKIEVQPEFHLPNRIRKQQTYNYTAQSAVIQFDHMPTLVSKLAAEIDFQPEVLRVTLKKIPDTIKTDPDHIRRPCKNVYTGDPLEETVIVRSLNR